MYLFRNLIIFYDWLLRSRFIYDNLLFNLLWIILFFIGWNMDGLKLILLLFFNLASCVKVILLRINLWDLFCQNIFYLISLDFGFRGISCLRIVDFLQTVHVKVGEVVQKFFVLRIIGQANFSLETMDFHLLTNT